MDVPALEAYLKKRIQKRRITESLFCLGSLAVMVLFIVLYALSKEVTEIESVFGTYQTVMYNPDFIYGIGFGLMALTVFTTILICDLLGSKLHTLEVGGAAVTLYRGLFHTKLYVNGTLADSLTFSGYHMEALLPDGSKVNVALGKWSAHLTFSNGAEAVDV